MPLTLEGIQNKEVTVGVIGLGYVGFPLSLAFAEKKVKVIGFDVDKTKIEAINEGRSYIHHIPKEKVKSCVDQKLFFATTDFSLTKECQALIICVPTPLGSHMEPDLRFIEVTCESIAPHLQKGTLVSLESTTWPGTTDEVMRPILEKGSNLKTGESLMLAFSPEREDPGNPDFGTKNIPKLIGADDEKTLELAAALYAIAIQTVIPVPGTRVAESAKLFENIFRSVNIALVNEMKIIMDKMGIDVWEVLKAAGTKPFGFMPFWPGPGLGGHCIPIDPFYLSWKAKEAGMPTRFIELAGEINRAMPKWVVGKIQDCLNQFGKPLKNSRILVLGLAYKSDVADMRESPSLELMRLLEEKGAVVDYNDPFIDTIPSNREHPEFIGKKSCSVSSSFDCILLSTAHSSYDAEKILSAKVPIVDTRNFFPNHPLVFPA